MSPGQRALAAFTIAAVALAGTLLPSAWGSSSAPRAGVVRVLPTAGGRADAWRWNARCTLGPVAGVGCDEAGPILGVAQLNGDEWNLGGTDGDGAVGMSVSSDGAVSIDGRFARTPPCTESSCLASSANTWVRGYPNVLYGIDQCRAGSSPRTSPVLPLPLRLDAVPPHLVGVTAYSSRTAGVMYDTTYDLWLNPSGTTTPCRTKGTLEILVMTDYDARAVAPESTRVGTARIPVAVGKTARSGGRLWSIYAANIGGNGWTADWGGALWFVPPRADVVHRGRVSVDLSAVFAEAGRLLRERYGWHDIATRYWLDTAAFGVEYGPPSGDPFDAGPTRFSARISAYCLTVGRTVRSATCG